MGTIISFRVGAKDAGYLSREFQSIFSESDLISLPNHQIYLKLLIDGFTSKAFSAEILPPPQVRVSYKEKIIELSRKNYCESRKEVEKNIFSR